MLKINPNTEFNIGLCLSGFGHVVLISCVLLGGFFVSKNSLPPSLITKVSIISEKEFRTKLFLEQEEFLKAKVPSVPKSTEEPALITLKLNNTEVKINGAQLVDDESTSLIILNSVDTKSGDVKNNKLNLNKVSEKSELVLNESSLNKPLLLQRDTKIMNPGERKSLFVSEMLKPLLTKPVAEEDASLQSSGELYQNLPVIKISDKIIKEAFENDMPNDPVVKKMLQGILEPAVGECFSLGLGRQDISKADILVSFSLREDGKPIISSINFESFSGDDYMTASKLFDVARRAIIRCGLNGYQLPNSKYNYWKNVEARFNLKGMSLK